MDRKIGVMFIFLIIGVSMLSIGLITNEESHVYASTTLKQHKEVFFSDGEKYTVKFDSPTHKFGCKNPNEIPLILHAYENDDLKGVEIQKENPADDEYNKYVEQNGNITLYKNNDFNVAVKQIGDFYIEITGADKELVTKMAESATID